jgi:hypothetical protein
VEIIGARLRHRVDRPSRVLSVLSRHGAGFHFEFLQRIRKWKRQIQIVERIVMSASIQQVHQAVIQPTGDGNGLRGIIPVRRLRASSDSRARENNQFDGLPAIERQFEHSRVIGHLADAGVSRFDQCRIGLHFYLIGNLTDFQNNIHGWVCGYLKDDSALHMGLETGKHCFQPIRSDRQVRQEICTGFVRYCSAHDPRLDLRRRNLRARQNRACLISH